MTEPKAEWHLRDHLDRPTSADFPGDPRYVVDKDIDKGEPYDASEQDIIIDTFAQMLRSATSDGGRKRAAGLKPPWYIDGAHEAAIFSHLNKWKHGEVRDPDSGAHPLVHLAWRALAIAYQESFGKHDPRVNP